MLAGAVLAVLVAQPAEVLPRLAGPVRAVVFVGGAWLVFAAGGWLVRRLPVRTASILIVLGGAALPLAAASAPPRSSDDMYRYIWDGRVQAAGIDAYRYVPAAPELAGQRDDFLWPARATWCVPADAVDPDRGRPLAAGCTLINRPTVHTVYPPVAQALFWATQQVSPPHSRERPLQLVMTAFALATTILLLVGLRSGRADPRLAVLWAWCPTVALEAGNNAHVDVVAVFVTGLALLVLARAGSRRATALGGVLLGLAVATKLTPILVAPAVLRRRPVLVATATAAAVAVVYLPHLAVVGADAIGYLPGYLNEEGYLTGPRFALLTLVLPDAWAGPAAVAVLAAVALLAARTAQPDRPWLAATTMTGAALIVAAPSYPWYALLLVLLVALSGRTEWLAVAFAAYLAQYAAGVHLATGTAQRIGYGAALIAVVVAAIRRKRARGSASAPPFVIAARRAAARRRRGRVRGGALECR
ncbi:glycosyltransferase 87 family protein [Dactylosporangium sp. NBC_01737]|uniref:glycosyltransferase 87 family protein n=1 Tax=Dactylosporangium sp. NBC_01737 TaxID=2975959 RepID=UPI002E0FBB07|nr:glycosyltransferase 87 family protein [Dactylosporangium sp. NBC_01737]